MTMTAYYNEFDENAAAWLEELIADGQIAPGIVDSRSIKEVTSNDIRGFSQDGDPFKWGYYSRRWPVSDADIVSEQFTVELKAMIERAEKAEARVKELEDAMNSIPALAVMFESESDLEDYTDWRDKWFENSRLKEAGE